MSENPIDIRELLDVPMSEFPDMPDLPGGKHFYGKLLSVSASRSREKQTPFFHFAVRLTDPGDDVPREALKTISDAGFSIGDYQVGADFYITPNKFTRQMLRRFLTSLGFSENMTFFECLKLAPDGNPTSESQDVVRGLDVVVRIPQPDENGRIYLNNVDMIAGRAK